METKKLGVLVGSLRTGSFNREIARFICSSMPQDIEPAFFQIGDLAVFNQDNEASSPKSWADFRTEVAAADAFLFATPEYNRSFPAAIKNALDIASRGENLWNGKPGAIVSASPGKMGGVCATQQLRQTLSYLGVILLPQPEVYVSGVAALLDEEGRLSDEKTQKFLLRFAETLAAWVHRF